MLEPKYNMELNPKLTKSIDDYLRAKMIQAFIFLVFINAGVLYSIYTFVSDKVAEAAVKKAITSTESQMKGLSKQFEQLSSRTTDGFANALMSLGDARAKVDAINQDVLGLKNLDLKQVKDVTTLLNNSSDEIVSLIESTKALKETDRLRADVEVKTLALAAVFERYEKSIDKKVSTNSKLISELNGRISIASKNGSTVYKLGHILIETGTIPFPQVSHISQVKFSAEFEDAPEIVATGESDINFDYGYPLLSDITKTGFTCSLLDKVANNSKVLPKKGGKVVFIAIGRVKRK